MPRNAPTMILVAALAVSAALTLVLTWHLTFFQDTWDYLITRRAITADTVFSPHNEHIVAIPVLIEQLFLRVFGMSTAKPEYVLLVIGLLATAYLLFVYLKRRVDPWLALFAVALLLFLGPAFEVLLWPFEICFIGSTMFGIATLLALEREDLRGDVAACGFLVASLGFSSLGIVFLVAGFVAVILGRADRRFRRAYVFVLPGLLFAAWYVGWGHKAESHLSVHNLLASPRYVIEGVSVTVGSLSGVGSSPYGQPVDPAWGFALLVAMIIGLAYRQMRKPTVSPGLWPAAAALASYWFLAAFNEFPGREPTASRYQYAGAVLLFMVLANLLPGVRVGRRLLLLGAVATAAALGPNLVILNNAKDSLEEQTVFTRADTAALEIARRTVQPDFQLNPEVAGTPSLVNVYAGSYLEAVDEYGSPAYTPMELAGAPEPGRRAADVILSQALPISTATRNKAYEPEFNAENCVALPAGSLTPTSEVRLGPGLTRIELAPGPHAGFSLRRFAVGEFPAATKGGPGGSVTILRIPRDESDRPWYLHVEASQAARVCR
jgi:hypothetical protein